MSLASRLTAFGSRMRRLYFRRLLVPLFRGQHSAQFTARGAMVGLAVAFTPLVGVQMPIVFAVWLIVRYCFPRYDFHLVVGLAWTWVSNVVTLPPIYYVFLVTGQLILGHGADVGGFGAFSEALAASSTEANTLMESLWAGTKALFEAFGVPMFVGCVPWIFIMGWVGYKASYSVIVNVRARRRARAERRSAVR